MNLPGSNFLVYTRCDFPRRCCGAHQCDANCNSGVQRDCCRSNPLILRTPSGHVARRKHPSRISLLQNTTNCRVAKCNFFAAANHNRLPQAKQSSRVARSPRSDSHHLQVWYTECLIEGCQRNTTRRGKLESSDSEAEVGDDSPIGSGNVRNFPDD